MRIWNDAFLRTRAHFSQIKYQSKASWRDSPSINSHARVRAASESMRDA